MSDEPLLELRQRAEQALGSARRAPPDRAQLEELLYELDVHRVELQMQNHELRAAQAQLTTMRDRYRAIYEQAPVGYVTLDDRGRIAEVNERAGAMLADTTSPVGRTLGSMLSQQDADRLHRHLMKARASGYDEGCELTLLARPAFETPVHVTSRAITDGLGQPSGFRSVLIDLSELRRAEDSLRMVEARNEVIFEQSHEAILRCDESWRIEAVNHVAGELFGYELDELIGGDLRDLVPALGRLVDSSTLEEPTAGVHRDGTTIPLQVRLGPWTESGRRKLMVFIVDVTERVAREEQLRHAQKMEAVGTLASGVAHDFNNVLQAVLGCLLIARSESTPIERVRELMDRAAFAVRHGGELTRGLLSFARRQEVEKRELGLDRLVRTMAPLIERLVTESIAVEVVGGAPQQRILADPVQIEQILMNLAANARDAMPSGGKLTIRTEMVEPSVEPHGGDDEPRPWVRLVVEDTGTGMDAETRRRIFDPFFTTKQPGKGTGLGLATVLSAAKELGATVDVQSEPGLGTRFTFAFPSIEGSTGTATSTLPTPRLDGGTVLLVEDDPLIRMSTRHHLEQLGLEVIEAQRGQEALDLVSDRLDRVDLLVSDIALPAMMGTALASALRRLRSDLPVLFITADPEPGQLADMPEGSMVLRKPFTFEELAERVSRALSSRVASR